jgi:protein TonB
MDVTRIGSIVGSALIHCAMLVPLISFAGSSALDAGSGQDQFNIENGVALEGLSFGDAPETVHTIEQPPVEEIAAPPPAPEVKQVEQPPEAITTASLDQKEEVQVREPDPPQETPPEPVPQVTPQQAVPEQVAVETEAASAKQTAGDPTKFAKYLGTLRTQLEKHKINPRSRFSGTVWLRFTVGENGEIVTREVATSSGSKVLDDAAVSALERAAPFPPIPTEVGTRPLVVSVPFKFVAR